MTDSLANDNLLPLALLEVVVVVAVVEGGDVEVVVDEVKERA